MTTDRTQNQIPPEQLEQSLKRGIDGADAARAEGLEGLCRFCDARANGLTREHTRLSARLNADHPRVRALEQRIATEQTLKTQLALETARARTATPTPDAKNYVLHGRVYHQFQPAAGLTVALLDSKCKERAKSTGYHFTDDKGYFKIECPFTGSVPQSYLIGVFKDDQPIYIDDCPVILQGGQVVYREIFLTSLDPLGTAPPPGSGDPDPPPGNGDPPPAETVRLESLSLQAQQDREGNYLIASGSSATGTVKLNRPATKLTVVSLELSRAHRELLSVQPARLEFPPGSQEATFQLTTHRVFLGRKASLDATLDKEKKSIQIHLLSAGLRWR